MIPERVYRVFISSTQEDLCDERQALIHAILEDGHIPIGMEMFPAGDRQEIEVIKDKIRELN